ncbi:glycoside hydrolase family 61 protein [Apiospora kogelbergensis]|uniref:glycoside hydrolase family 61 protein n=1 Tax=Apiospora kogelbergensis TaxID=1337665 RepID=UPI00312F8285
MKSAAITAVLASVASAHYTFPKISGTSDWAVVRKTQNWQSNGPVTDVGSTAIRCYQLGGGAAGVQNVQAGGSVVPAGADVKTWDGSGSVWFKVYQDMPASANGGYKWTSEGQSSFSLPVPRCLPEGDYLYRIEHVALHGASQPGGAQFYISCAQVHVAGGSGAKTPTGLVSFPGAYKASDPGLAVNIYNTGGKAYQPAGPSVFQC